MKAWFTSFLLCFGLFGMAGQGLAASYDEGIEYQRIQPPQPTQSPDKVEVVELFWYGCPHCHQLEPTLKDWLARKPDYVEFVRMPAILGPRWELLARAYFAAELLDVLDKVHEPMFHALHVEKRRLDNLQAVAAFFEERGVAKSDFLNAFNSFAASTRLNQARIMSRRYGLTGVPTIVINGKFRTQASLTGNNETMMKVVDYLAEREHKAATMAGSEAQ